MLRVSVPFPPYTESSCARRFPDDTMAHKRILLLHQAITGEQSRVALSREYGVSQARISQLVHTWEEHGLRALLTHPQQRKPCPPDEAVLRRCMRAIATTTSFEIGRKAFGAMWAGHIADPALRGQWIVRQLREGMDAVDAELEAKYRISRLLERHLVDNEDVQSLSEDSALSRSRVYAIVHHGLKLLQAKLAQPCGTSEPMWPWHVHLLNTPLVGRDRDMQSIHALLVAERALRITGLPGIGKSTLAASLAAAWDYAGWNVYWVRTNAEAFAAEQLLQTLHGIAASYGVVSHLHLDPSRPPQEHTVQVQHALTAVPTVLMIDDVHLPLRSTRWRETILHLYKSTPTLRLVLVGHECDLEIGKEWYVSGLEKKDAVALNEQSPVKLSEARWQQIFHQSGGNPKILRLLQHNVEAAVDAVDDLQAVLRVAFQQLSHEARKLLLWLSWWEGPVTNDHLFVQVIQPSQLAWQQLLRHHFLTAHTTQVVVHDLIKEHLATLASQIEWNEVCAEVRAYAYNAHDWVLAYRCATSQGDIIGQIELSERIAHQAMQQGESQKAQYWWRVNRSHHETVDDTEGSSRARLAEAAALLHALQPKAALDALAPLEYDINEAVQWKKALLEVEAYRLLGDGVAMTQAISKQILRELPPPSIDAAERWHLELQHVLVQNRLGNYQTAWNLYQNLAAAPKGTPTHLLREHSQAGALLALEHNDYGQFKQLSKRFNRYVRAQGHRHDHCAAQIEWARVLHAQERHGPARELLRQTQPLLEPDWHVLWWRLTFFQALIEYDLGNFRAALHAWEQANVVTNELGTQGFAGHIALVRALIGIGTGDFVLAHEQLVHAYHSYEQSTNKIQLGVVQFWLGRLEVLRRNTQQAAVHLHQALKTIRTLRAQRFLINFRLTWSEYCLHTLAPHNAYRAAQRTSSAAAAQGLGILHAKSLTTEAEALLQLGELSLAVTKSKASVVLIQPYRSGLEGAPQIWCNHARVLEALQCSDEAQAAWEHARNHVLSQLRSLPSGCDEHMFLAQPYHATIVTQYGDVARMKRNLH